jgi:hypothetical protein
MESKINNPEIESKLIIECEIDDTPVVKKQYEVEDILEMLGGDKYYSMDKVMFVYHWLREEFEEAEYYKDITDKKEIAMNKKLSKMQNKNLG